MLKPRDLCPGLSICVFLGTLAVGTIGSGTAAGVKARPNSRAACPVKVSWQGKRAIVVLDEALQRSLRRHYPGWALPPLSLYDPDVRSRYESEPERGVPFACCGDFDGNGLADAALILRRRRTHWLVVVFHQTRRGVFRPYPIDRWNGKGDVDDALQMTIEQYPRGPVTYLIGGPDMQTATRSIRHDGIFEFNDEGYGRVYYFTRGRYRWLEAGD
jgi:hypothetical protein